MTGFVGRIALAHEAIRHRSETTKNSGKDWFA
jgi:hypothetical protein